MSEFSVLLICGFLFWTLTGIGMVFDKSPWAWINELIRSATFMLMYFKFGTWNEFKIPVEILYAVFVGSIAISLISIVGQMASLTASTKKKQN